MFKNLLCAIDGSAQSNKAVELAADLAVRYGAALTLIHVVTATSIPAELASFVEAEYRNPADAAAFGILGQRIVEDAVAIARKGRSLKPVQVVDRGEPAERILDFAAREQVDGIVVGRRGHGRLAGLLLGSISSKIAQLAACTVILVR